MHVYDLRMYFEIDHHEDHFFAYPGGTCASRNVHPATYCWASLSELAAALSSSSSHRNAHPTGPPCCRKAFPLPGVKCSSMLMLLLLLWPPLSFRTRRSSTR